MVKLKLIIIFIDNKEYTKGILFFTTLLEEYVGKSFYSYERKYDQSISDGFQLNLTNIMKVLSQS